MPPRSSWRAWHSAIGHETNSRRHKLCGCFHFLFLPAGSWRISEEFEDGWEEGDGRTREKGSRGRSQGTPIMNAIAKLHLNGHITVPFNKLKLDPRNVRRLKVTEQIGNLAQSIGQLGLIQSLSVRAETSDEGRPTGFYLVQAGGRRYRALELLVSQKRLPKTAPVPCLLAETGLAEETSLAENEHRMPLHPADQYRAFQAMRVQGRSIEDIAAAFLTTPETVKQRLRLATVSPTVFAAYEADEMQLDQLMAFTVTDDHDRQDQVWQMLQQQQGHSRYPGRIRSALMEKTVRVTDRRFQFIGADAYVSAGGIVSRDLFEADDGGWAENVVLLEQMVGAKLAAAAEQVKAEGWKWTEHAISFPYNHTAGMRRVHGSTTLTAEEQDAAAALEEQIANLVADFDEAKDLPDEIDAAVAALEEQLEQYQRRRPAFTPEEMAIAGCVISLDQDGEMIISAGWVRPEDDPLLDRHEAEAPSPTETSLVARGPSNTGEAAEGAASGQPAKPGDQNPEADTDEGDGISERLRAELTATRTVALRDAVGSNPRVAMTAMLYQLVCGEFRVSQAMDCLDVRVIPARLNVTADDLAETTAARNIEERRQFWLSQMPRDAEMLWQWIDGLSLDQQMALMAHCVGLGVNAQFEKVSIYGPVSPRTIERRIAEADHLAQLTNLDMAEQGWTATPANYLGRVSKRQILAAVREGKSERHAQMIEHLKKGDMAAEAERLLKGTGWVPEQLRTPPTVPTSGDAGAGPAEDLPDFLVADTTTETVEETEETDPSGDQL